MPITQLLHQVLGWLAVVSAAAVLVLAGAAELQEPPTTSAAAKAGTPQAALVAAESQRADTLADHEDALGRVEAASFAAIGLALLMALTALAGAAPRPFVTISEALLVLAVLQTLLFELGDPVGILHVLFAAALLGGAVRAVARHSLLTAPWRTPLPRDAAVPV